MSKRIATTALFTSLTLASIAPASPAFAEVAVEEQVSTDEATVESLYEDLAALQSDFETLSETSEAFASDPAFQAFAAEIVVVSEQHANDIIAASEATNADVEAGTNIYVARDKFEDAYNKANSKAFNAYHEAKDDLNAQWNANGTNDELKNEFNDAYNNALAEVSNVLEQIKALINSEINSMG